MSNIKIKLSVDADNTAQVTALSDYLQALRTIAEAKRPLVKPETPVKEMEVVSEEVPGKPKASSQTPSGAKSTESPPVKSEATAKTHGSKKSPTSAPKTKSSTAKKDSSTKVGKESPSKAKTDGPKDLREPLRELLSEKVGDHREEIKKELAKYDAKNITRLPEEHHAEFMAFMEKLA